MSNVQTVVNVSTVVAQTLALPGVRHAFFTREGGVSTGIYASLNAGLGSRDDRAAVRRNHDVVTDELRARRGSLVTMHQTHSADVAVVDELPAERPRVDGIVSARPGVVLGVLTADCAPVLFCDPDAGIVGAAHAGWRGALAGVLEETVATMERLGARRDRLRAAVGPTIAQASYEVGADLMARFAGEADAARFFAPGRREGHAQFDLPGYIAHRLAREGVTVEDTALDTYADEARFFSYRRATHRGEPDYGRMVGAIVLAE